MAATWHENNWRASGKKGDGVSKGEQERETTDFTSKKVSWNLDAWHVSRIHDFWMQNTLHQACKWSLTQIKAHHGKELYMMKNLYLLHYNFKVMSKFWKGTSISISQVEISNSIGECPTLQVFHGDVVGLLWVNLVEVSICIIPSLALPRSTMLAWCTLSQNSVFKQCCPHGLDELQITMITTCGPDLLHHC